MLAQLLSYSVTGLTFLKSPRTFLPQEDGPAPAPLGMPHWQVPETEPLGLRATIEKSGQFFFEHLRALSPGQTTAIWFGLVVILVLAFRWQKILSWRNLLLALLFLPALIFFDLDRQSAQLGEPVSWSRFGYLTILLMAAQVLTLIWALFGRFGRGPGLPIHLPDRALKGLAGLGLMMTLLTCLFGAGADSSIYTNFGAQRLRERGKLPYGDPWLAKGTATAYGPAIYLMILPAQLIVEPQPLNADVAIPTSYQRSRGLPVRLTVAALVLLSFGGLVALGRRLAGPAFGWALAALVFSSPYVLGVGSDVSTLVGAANISDVAPMAFMILAILWLGRRPIWSGLALGQATACGLFPILCLPLCLLWLKGEGKPWKSFTAAYLVLGCAYLAFIMLATESRDDEHAIQAFLDCVVGMQVNPAQPELGRVGYGNSPFGFWGSHPRWRDAFLGEPGGSSKVYWGYLCLGAILVAAYWRSYRASFARLLALVAALCLSFQLLRLHASGVHVMWYYPFLLAALLAPGLREQNSVPQADEDLALKTELEQVPS